LIDHLSDPNDWFARDARRILAERRDAAALPILRQRLQEAREVRLQLEYVWALYVSGGLTALDQSLLQHPSAAVRAWMVRLLGDERTIPPDLVPVFAEMASRDPSP